MSTDLLGRALAAALRDAPGPNARRWLARAAGWDGPLPEPAATDLDALLDQMWRVRGKAGRRALGQVFTPRDVARQVLLETPGADRGGLLDPACGGGVFLAEAAELRAERWTGPGLGPALLADLHGVDLDPDAARLARLLLAHVVVRRDPDAEGACAGWPLPSVVCADATDPAVAERFTGRITSVVGNPPYREAKGMPRAERERLRRRFGVDRAFDLYLCFVVLGLELVGPGGAVAYVLPNKFLVARYAEDLRRRLFAEGQLHALLDLSELDVFGGIGVYPVVVVLGPPRERYKAVFAVRSDVPLGRAPLPGVEVGRWLAGLGSTWITVPPGPLAGLLQRVAGAFDPLGAQVEVRSTCSFHARGLREQFVGEVGLPYLGGRSFSRRNEIVPFGVRWEGHHLRYDEAALRAAGNPLPPLALFTRPKVVLCQHARTPVGWFDADGVYVTKDVYPVAAARDADPRRTAAFAALLNSRVFAVLYALMYRGIAIGSGYLHFLPAFLHAVPAPPLEPALGDAVVALQAAPTRAAVEALDRAVAAAYGLTEDEADAVRAFADHALGFAPDPLARR
ncbi:MAG: N-6 DNA methylase [Myxococcota bacterium]